MSRIAAPFRRLQRSRRRARGIEALARCGHPAAPTIAGVIRSARSGNFTADETAWVEHIEAARAALNESTQPVRRVDYGAGDPDSTRSGDTMHDGVGVTETLGRISRVGSKSLFWCGVLFRLVRAFRPRSAVEMGSCVGVSASYQSAALVLNGAGSLVTIEGDGTLADVARRTLGDLGFGNARVVTGPFDATLDPVLDSMAPVDYVFVDGHHDGDATLDYFERIMPRRGAHMVIVFDDIAWSPGMVRAWSVIASDPRVSLAVDLGALGVCIVDGTTGPCRLLIPLA
jgi:Methyltransferase domain